MAFHLPGKKLTCKLCDKPAAARGLCKPHYYKLRNAGELDQHKILTQDDLFEHRIQKTETCWIWLGNKHQYGYGIVLLPGEKRVRAHRYAYEKWVGPIPDGLVVLHSCDNPICVNPAHLSVGTRGDNNRDAKAKDRNARGSRNGHAKLTEADVAFILASPLPQKELAKMFAVHQSGISRLKNGKRWKHVTTS